MATKKTVEKQEARVMEFPTADSWREWLDINNTLHEGVWLKISKKGSELTTVTYQEALEVALCYGWIDGQVNKLDDKYYIQKFTPRRAKSIWSQRNVGIVERLIDEGKMQPSGLKAINEAKADGRWQNAYGSASNVTVPDYFIKALEKNEKANNFYKTLNKTSLFAIYFRLQTAKTQKTREKRIDEIIDILERGEKI